MLRDALIFNFFRFIYFMHVFFMHVCTCTLQVPCFHESQRRGLEPREPEFWVIANHHMGAENQTNAFNC